MKPSISAIALGLSVGATTINPAEAKTIAIPGSVVGCYKKLAGEILEGNVTRRDIERYVNPENVLTDMRNPVTDNLEEKVIQSALSFTKFIINKARTEGGRYSAQDVSFTQYKRWSHKILVGGNIGGKYNFKLYLEPTGCKVLNFTVEGLKSMRDGIPRR